MSGAYSGLGVGGPPQLHHARGTHSLNRGAGGGGAGGGAGDGGGGRGGGGAGGMLNDHDGYAQVLAAASAAGLGAGPGGGLGTESFSGMLMGDGSMMGANGLLNGLDMDMSLPMDMDLDLSQAGGADSAFVMPGQTPAHQQQLADALMAASSGDGGPTTSSAPPPESNMTGIGAGPLPTGFGMPAPQGGTTLTEFTKRRNWSQRIIEELKDFLHILTPDGRILYVSPSCKAITGYDTRDLVGKFIGEYVHPDDSGIFMREFNESIASGHSLRFFYRFKKEDGTYTIFECDGHPHISPEPSMSLQGYNASPEHGNQPGGLCKGFFMMARPYPTKNAALLDSFLEHKIENERLMKKIAELKREEQEENAEQERLYQEQAVSQTSASPLETQVPSRDNTATSEAPASTPNYQGMPPPARPPVSNTALTRQNLDSALSAQKPDSIADKMSRYEANSTHLESIELLTGLRYRDGERSHGISTGDTSPALIRGDAGIAILLDRDREGSKKEKKKLKVADEYVCADCGTLDSPEWRKGPKGPKTLCNACGLRWAKKEKKRSSDDVRTSDSGAAGMQPSMAPGQQMGGVMGGANGGSLPQVPGLPMQSSSGSA